MKTISNWSIAGILAGLTFSIGSFVRYYILYPDFDKAITDVIIGLLVCAVAFLYNRLLGQGNNITAIEDFLDDKREETTK